MLCAGKVDGKTGRKVVSHLNAKFVMKEKNSECLYPKKDK